MNRFNAHLKSVNENYFEHAIHALSFAVTLALAAVVCLIHAIFPFLFEKTGSKLITRLHDKMVINRVKNKSQ